MDIQVRFETEDSVKDPVFAGTVQFETFHLPFSLGVWTVARNPR
jgi:hypothetical protein